MTTHTLALIMALAATGQPPTAEFIVEVDPLDENVQRAMMTGDQALVAKYLATLGT